MRRESIDFHAVPERQEQIHADLLNWALYCRGGSGPEVSPMFRDYRPERATVYNPPNPKPVCDWSRAMRTNGKVSGLPLCHRLATQWYYIRKDSPAKAKDRCQTSYEGLAMLVVEARDMMTFVGA